MKTEILEYLKSQRICVLAVEMPDGSPHAATVHFAFDERFEKFIIMTNPSYRKYEALARGTSRASIVVGSNEEDMRTFQLDGTVSLLENGGAQKLYLEKFPEKLGKYQNDVLFAFTPTWWRFTDWTHPEGKAVYTSDGKITYTKLK